MEWAIHLDGADQIPANLSELRPLISRVKAKLRPVVDASLDLIDEYFGNVGFTRHIFGNEFCEHLIPLTGQVQRMARESAASKTPLTFLTPYVTDDGIATLRSVFDVLSSTAADGTEVVFNDWGVLNVLKREFPSLKPVQGRLMNKSLRDPRVTGTYASSPAPGSTLVSLRRSNLDSGGYRDFLAGMGVESVEFDNLPQGIDLECLGGETSASVYLPFGFISTSRVCMAAGIHYGKQDKFQPGAPCRHECQTHLLEYTYTNSPFGTNDQKFYLKGNTYFYAHTEQMLRTLFEQARAGQISRLVFQPELPMTWQRNTTDPVPATAVNPN